MAIESLQKEPDVLELLSVPGCSEPEPAPDALVWVFGCGLGVSERFIVSKVDLEHIGVLREAHLNHHVFYHPSHGERWGFVETYEATGGGWGKYKSLCPGMDSEVSG